MVGYLSIKHVCFIDIMPRKKQSKSIDSKVISRIYGNGKGYVFTPRDFSDLGTLSAIDKALSRNCRAGTIRKLARGLYDYPRRDPKLGLLAPSTDSVANALKDRDSTRIQPSGAHAAKLLGLSEQVPVRAVYLTDGRSRKVQLGRRQIILKHTTPRNMATAGRISGTVIQALRWLRRPHVDDKTIGTLRRKLSDKDKQQLINDLQYAPAWIADILRKVAAPAGK